MSDVAKNGYFATSCVSSAPAGFVGCDRVTAEPGGRMEVPSGKSRTGGLFSAVADSGEGFLAPHGLDRLRALGGRTFFVVKKVPCAAADSVIFESVRQKGEKKNTLVVSGR